MDTDAISNQGLAVRPALRPSRVRGVTLTAPQADPQAAIRAAWAAVLGAPTVGAEVLAELQAISLPRELPAGASLISRRHAARDIVVLARGDAALGSAHDDAPFRPERALQGPQWLDASSAWLGGMHAQDAVAVSDVQLLSVPRVALQQAMAQHPELARRIVLVLAHQVHALTEVTHDLMHKDAETRFAAWLVQRCVDDPAVPGTGIVALHERKRDIAAQLAITPETLSRLLRQLNRKGLIDVMGYTVKVLDLSALRAIAGS